MAKVVVAGDAVVVTSTLKLEDIATVKKYRKEELTLKGGEEGKTPIFVLGTTEKGAGSIDEFGAMFARKDAEGFAQVTIVTTKAPAEVKEWIADTYGSALCHLAALEEKLPAVVEAITAEKNAIMESITTL